MNHLTIGVLGAGGFASWATKAFLKIEGVHIKSVADIDENNARQLATATNARVASEEDLYTDPEIDLIYIGTPPSQHFSQSLKALRAGKHVICEKPAALREADAQLLSNISREKNLLYTVNLMQRYNPLYDFVTELINEKWLGEFLHGFFENYASDEKLVSNHWFWQQDQSGGIFVEHGVHFFDMFSGWLGKGSLINAFEIQRDYIPTEIVDRVQAVVMYEKGPVTFYHGFNQPKLLDRQELRLQFERGDVTLYEWIPVKIRIHGLMTNEVFEKIKSRFRDVQFEITEDVHPGTVTGHFKQIQYDVLATITSGNIRDKMGRYEQLVIRMLRDQWAWIRDKNHIRKIDDRNAVESLAVAEQAHLKSQQLKAGRK